MKWVKQMRELVPRLRYRLFLLWAFSAMHRQYAAPDLQKQQHQTDAQQNVSDPGHTGDRRAHTSGKRGPQYLEHPPHQTLSTAAPTRAALESK